MKKYINFILLLITITACKAQSPVYDISEVHRGKAQGSYFKDLNNVLDGYDGTYLYTNGNTSLKIMLKKKVLSKGYHYQDLIVGEFQYIENGVELNNTLANMNVNYTDEDVNHRITGYRIITGTRLGCPDCTPTEKRLRLSFAITVGNKGGMSLKSTTVTSFTYSGRSPGKLGQEIRSMNSTSSLTVSKLSNKSPQSKGGCK